MAWPCPLPDRRLVLLVGHRLQPFDRLAVERFLHGDMHHHRSRPGAVPVLFARRNPDHVAGADFAHLAAPALHPAAAGHDTQSLPERMGVPMGAGAGLEAHQAGADARRRRRMDDGVLPHDTGERVRRPAARWPGATGMNVHGRCPPMPPCPLLAGTGGSRRSKIMEILPRYPRYHRIGAARPLSRRLAKGAIIARVVRGIMADDARIRSPVAPRVQSHCGLAMLRLAALLGFGLMLGP